MKNKQFTTQPKSKIRFSGMKLSVVLATYNEEANISGCLSSIKDIADELIIVDGESTDNTREIAKKFGAKVFIEENKPIFHINKQIALDKAIGEWILQLDADERIDKELKKAITQVINQPQSDINGYYLKRKNFFLGSWLKKGGQYPDPVIRLILRGKASFPQKSVHEQISVEGKLETLEGHLLHHTAPTFSRYLTNSNRYTSLTATELKRDKTKINLSSWVKYIFLKPVASFFNLYFRHKGILDGFPGFVFALFSSLHWPIAFMKYWELTNVGVTRR